MCLCFSGNVLASLGNNGIILSCHWIMPRNPPSPTEPIRACVKFQPTKQPSRRTAQAPASSARIRVFEIRPFDPHRILCSSKHHSSMLRSPLSRAQPRGKSGNAAFSISTSINYGMYTRGFPTLRFRGQPGMVSRSLSTTCLRWRQLQPPSRSVKIGSSTRKLARIPCK
jgi:hypothetical protein